MNAVDIHEDAGRYLQEYIQSKIHACHYPIQLFTYINLIVLFRFGKSSE